MGVVFLAQQVSLNRPVAIKMILAGQLANDVDVRRFYTEAESAGNLDHPGIVPIYEVSQHDGQHYFSMGYIEGESLSRRLADGPLDSREAAAMFVEVAEAIDYAHKRGVLHRDIKPANILLDRSGRPRITDFGLARRLEGDNGLTGSGQIMGTPSYMAPEQAAASKQLTTATDVYGVGAALYETLTGQPPFRGPSPLETLMEVLEKPPASPRSLVPDVDRGLELICLKCLEKDPARRYATAGDLAGDLKCWLADEPLSVRPPGVGERAARWLKRNALAALVVVAIGLVWGMAVGVLAARPLALTEALPLWPRDLSNPLGWVRLVLERGDLIWAALAIAAIPTLALGWLIAALVRPRDRRGALAAASACGLIAAVVTSLVAGPLAAQDAGDAFGLGHQIHPIDENYLFTQAIIRTHARYSREDLQPSDLEYLKQFVPAPVRNRPDIALQVVPARARAQYINRLYGAFRGTWSVVLAATWFFLSVSTLGTARSPPPASGGPGRSRGSWPTPSSTFRPPSGAACRRCSASLRSMRAARPQDSPPPSSSRCAGWPSSASSPGWARSDAGTGRSGCRSLWPGWPSAPPPRGSPIQPSCSPRSSPNRSLQPGRSPSGKRRPSRDRLGRPASPPRNPSRTSRGPSKCSTPWRRHTAA